MTQWSMPLMPMACSFLHFRLRFSPRPYHDDRDAVMLPSARVSSPGGGSAGAHANVQLDFPAAIITEDAHAADRRADDDASCPHHVRRTQHMKAGQAVLEALRAEGVEYTFGVVGSTTNSIVTEMHGRSDIRFVDTRHEEGAAFMAYGYARASGKPTACITTSGPGTINLVTGISLAYKGRAPVIVIAGDVA